MPLVTRQANQGAIFRQLLEPGEWLNGDLWSDTTASILKLNVSGTATDVGATSFSSSATVSFSETIGDYIQPDSATATSAAPGPADFEDDFASVGAWSFQDTGKITISGGQLVANYVRDSSNDAGSDNITGINAALFRIEIDMSFNAYDNNSGTGNLGGWFGLSDLPSTTDFDTNQDFAGIVIGNGTGGGLGHEGWSPTFTDGSSPQSAVNVGENKLQAWNTSDTYFWRIDMLSSTSMKVTLFSNAARTTEISNSTLAVSGLAALDEIKVGNVVAATTTGTLDARFDNLAIWKTSNGDSPASNAVDDDTSTFWQSNAEANPAIFIDEGESNNFVGCALFWNANTTETSFTIRISTDNTFSAAEDVRTILTSAMTNGAFNFIRFNVAVGQFMQIRGASGSSLVLSINEIKSLTKTNTEILADLGIIEISPTDTSLALDGT